MNLIFIGGGTMAESMIRGALTNKLLDPCDISVCDISSDRCQTLIELYAISADTNLPSLITRGELVILAVKPQNFYHLSGKLKPLLNQDQTIVSVMAGITMSSLEENLSHKSIIRVMPNTASQIGCGISVWMTSSSVESSSVSNVKRLIQTLGLEIKVSVERYIDMATALSASGPAFVFTFIESMIDAGVYLGLTRQMSHQLALQTVIGSAQLMEHSGKHPAELRNMVTSPGGTTAEGLLALEEAGFRTAILNAVTAAYEKSLKLGDF
jgi:pyrroline-5-carboxylate reductase